MHLSRHAGAAALLLFGIIQLAGGRAAAQDLAPPALPTTDFRDIVQAAKTRVFPAVVYIRCMREGHESGKKISQEISGSGVIISPDGRVLTNWHVIEKAKRVRCLLSDGRAFEATVVGSDKSVDLALIQLEVSTNEPSLPYASFGNSEVLLEGDFVMAMGAPWGLNRSVSIGIISCTTRYLPETSEYAHWLQTDAAINPGNSGGPLVNTSGEIIGVNTRGMMMGDNVGFAVPSAIIQELLPHFVDHGKVQWSWTGLQLQALRDFNRDMYFDGHEGVIVAETDPDSPAKRAGVRALDRIMSVNGETITALTEEDLPSVRRELGFLDMDEPAEFVIKRGEEVLVFEITPREKGDVEGDELDLPRWDLTVKEINQFENEELYFYRKQGVFVYGVKYPGNAAMAGLSSNDIILSIDNTPVATLEDVRSIHTEALENIENEHRLVVNVLRGGLMRQIVLDYARDYSKK